MADNELIDSTEYLNDPTALRERAESDGFLFFRDFLPTEEVLRVRSEILGVLDRHGLRQSEQSPLGGALNVSALNREPEQDLREDIGVTHAIYHDVQKLSGVHRLPHHPRLLRLYRTLFDEQPFVHPRHIVRMMTPHPALTPTPAHQDFPHIQGTTNTWTCWFPIGDCPRDLGGLSVLRSSHRSGFIPVQNAPGAGGVAVQLCSHETEWFTTDYRVGDVLTFPSLTVHKALPCRSTDQIRLSFDVRYQPNNEPVDKKSLLPHCDLSWQQIYEDWDDDDQGLKFYWQDQSLNNSIWDDSLFQPGRRIC